MFFRCEVEDILQHKLELFTDNILIYKMEKHQIDKCI